jgi:phosphopantetheine adenylyltransferase
LPSLEPLHKHIWQPANVKHGQHIDVVVQGTKYFDELCVLIVAEFKLKMEGPNPNAWLEERLSELFSETEQIQTP